MAKNKVKPISIEKSRLIEEVDNESKTESEEEEVVEFPKEIKISPKKPGKVTIDENVNIRVVPSEKTIDESVNIRVVPSGRTVKVEKSIHHTAEKSIHHTIKS